jgi:hypothetical protein
VPRGIGNRANGFSYRPTPDEARPREAAAGIWPSGVCQAATDRTLAQINRDLLRDQGLTAKAVPAFV